MQASVSPLPTPPALTLADREALAACALEVVECKFPHKLDHLILHAGDVPLPSTSHPVFDGSYDWHSAVHMHWSLLRLLAMGLAPATEAAVCARFARAFTAEGIAQECAYVDAPGRGGFERPYGWGWLLKLQAELERHPRTAEWACRLRPLADRLAQRLVHYLAVLQYPIRAGTHANTAFSLLLAWDYAGTVQHAELLDQIPRSALRWFGKDSRYPAAYEPSGSDFLSGGLCEALLMCRVLPATDFAAWWSAFRPEDLHPWCVPAQVSDRKDAQIVHLDGLNLSRASCLWGLVEGLRNSGAADAAAPEVSTLAAAAQAHWDAAWPHVTGGDFVATHWLVSFALLR